jgi:hypothetical protein
MTEDSDRRQQRRATTEDQGGPEMTTAMTRCGARGAVPPEPRGMFFFFFHNLFKIKTKKDGHNYTSPRGPTVPSNGRGRPTDLQETRRRQGQGPGDNGPRARRRRRTLATDENDNRNTRGMMRAAGDHDGDNSGTGLGGASPPKRRDSFFLLSFIYLAPFVHIHAG